MGRPVTLEDWKRIATKPGESLTDSDITICGYFGGETAAVAARTRRTLALHPALADQPAPVTKAAAPRASVFPDRLWEDDAPDPVKAMDEWSEKYAMKALPIRLWWGFVSAGRENRKALEAKVAALEQEIAKLKARPLQKWAGIHVSGMPYSEASLVMKSGSLWVATTATTTTPGEPGGDWRLIVKRGTA